MTEKTGTSWVCSKERILKALPPLWPESLLHQIRERLARRKTKTIVLDDDPTGTQTVHDIPVITEWSVDGLAREIDAPGPGFYVLTNSRSLSPAETEALHRELAGNLIQALKSRSACDTLAEVCVISRSDSTLRGHFPLEINVLAEVLGPPDAIFIVPFFAEGGRLTVDNVHYLAQGEELVPVATTPFARDPVFGYQAANLREWIVEKTQGTVSGEKIRSLSLEDIRCGGPSRVKEVIRNLPQGACCIVNAADYRDLEVFTLALLDAEAEGRRFLFRSAASFVATRLGLESKPLLPARELCDVDSSTGGLVVCGSYVPISSRQLENLLALDGVEAIEFDVKAFLTAGSPEAYVDRVTELVRERLASGRHVALFTSREYVGQREAQHNLALGRKIASALGQIVRRLRIRPRFLIAKGGITSSDVATKGLGVKRAMVRGQALPGVPVWELGQDSLYPGLKYVVFPGNVGGPDSLAVLVSRLIQGE